MKIVTIFHRKDHGGMLYIRVSRAESGSSTFFPVNIFVVLAPQKIVSSRVVMRHWDFQGSKIHGVSKRLPDTRIT